MRRTTLGLAAAFALTSAVGPLAAARPAAAEGAAGYIATASAQGFRSTYMVPGQFVVEEIWDYGGPVAQGRVDSSGGSGYASLPFPGGTAIVAPNFTNIVGLPVIPFTYPFYVSASYPSAPSARAGDPSGNYGLDAKADAATSRAEAFARGGPDAGRLFRTEARTNIAQTGDTVVAQAETIMEGLSLGGVLTIGSTVARSTTTMTPGAPLQRTSQLEVHGVKVAGQSVGMGSNGVDDEALNDVLENAGLSVRIARQKSDEHGASADVLEITVSHPLPEGTADGVLRYRFGGASTSIVSGAVIPMQSIAATSPARRSSASYRGPYGLVALASVLVVGGGAAWLRRAGKASWTIS